MPGTRIERPNFKFYYHRPSFTYKPEKIRGLWSCRIAGLKVDFTLLGR